MVSELRTSAGHGVLDVVDDAVVERLRGRFAGQVLTPREEGYDDARRVWNASIQRYPALIARCSGVADVLAAVRFAREHELLVAVRGGGHNVAGNGTCDGGLVIDLSPMKGVRVDPTTCETGDKGRPRRKAWRRGQHG